MVQTSAEFRKVSLVVSHGLEVEKAPSARRTRDPDPAKHNAPLEPCLMSYACMNRATCSINHQAEMSVTCGMLLFLHTYVCTPCVCIHVSQCAPMCRAGHTHTYTHMLALSSRHTKPPGVACSPDSGPVRGVCQQEMEGRRGFKRVMANQSHSFTHTFTIHPLLSPGRSLSPSRCP